MEWNKSKLNRNIYEKLYFKNIINLFFIILADRSFTLHPAINPAGSCRNWENKQFPNTTIMFFGSICSIRPRIGIQFSIFSYSTDPPKKVEVFCDNDNKTYATLKGISIPNVPITFYPFYYTKKGFHHLKFIPDGNESACLDIDFQVGFKGFLNNILPYIGP